MFKQEYAKANDRVHADDALLQRIRSAQEKRRTPARIAWWASGSVVVTAAAVLIVILAAPVSRNAEKSFDAVAMEAEASYDLSDAAEESTLVTAEQPMLAAASESTAMKKEAAAGAEDVTGYVFQDERVVTGTVSGFEDQVRDIAMDDWFCQLTDGGSTLVAAKISLIAPWTKTSYLLDRPAQVLLTDDNKVYAIGKADEGVFVTVYELDDKTPGTLVSGITFEQSGSYLCALLENELMYLVTDTGSGLLLGVADMTDPDGWHCEESLTGTTERAQLFETSDGVLLCTESDGTSQLSVRLNEPDGLCLDANAAFDGVLLYAYRTRWDTWHTVFDVNGVYQERILDDSLSVLLERTLLLDADIFYWDDEELLALTLADFLHISHYQQDMTADPGYAMDWSTEEAALTGSPVCWDDDDRILYLWDGNALFAMYIDSGTVESVW